MRQVPRLRVDDDARMGRMCLSLVLVGLGGCDYPTLPRLAGDGGISGGDIADGAMVPASDSSTSPGSDGCTSFATLLALDTCQLAFADDLLISGGTVVYDTGAHRLTSGTSNVPIAHTIVTLGGDSVEVISARSVTLDVILLAGVGPLPLVIAASSEIRVGDGALLDVGNGGAGAQPSCLDGALPGAPDTGGAGGGGGAGYGADGGKGGNGDSDGTSGQSAGGARGRASAAIPSGLRGGCPGAPGGAGQVSGGAGGKPGGALYLVAAERIELGTTVALNAGGGPGLGGSRSMAGGDAGGGGGGSGGMLVLEAPHIIGPNATIAANGGGGGGGGSSTGSGADGSPGPIGVARAAAGQGSPGAGGGGSGGTTGGRGGSKAAAAGEDVTAILTGGGGGGGGGVGIIRVKSADLQLGLISPDPR